MIEHPYFDSSFKEEFELEFPELVKLDLEHIKVLTQMEHLTKDGRSELENYEIYTNSELEEDSGDGSSGEQYENSAGI